jgi:hypothetical protein
MESFRTIFFPQYPEKREDRTKSKCDSVPSVGSNYDRYKRNFAAPDAVKLQIVRISDPSL